MFHAKNPARSALRPITMLALGFLCAGLTHAVPSGISVSQVTPLDGNTLLVARTAANDPKDAPNFQLKVDVFIANSSMTAQEVDSISVTYPGSGLAAWLYTPQVYANNVGQPYVMAATDVGLLPVFDGLERDLPTPLPPSVRIEIRFVGDPDPIRLSYSLGFHENRLPQGAYFFPGKAEDLDPGEYWFYETRHVEDSGGGGNDINPTAGNQRYALDLHVAHWTGSFWTVLRPGAAAVLEDRVNEDYLIFGKPVYAMADGTVVSCYRGEMDHDPDDFADITFENGTGNSLNIRHGDEVAIYAHNMFGTIPLELCPNDGQNNNLNIPVQAGQFLGNIGNTGRSTNAHLHLQVNNVASGGPDTINGVPIQFQNVRALSDDDSVTNLGDSPTLKPLHGRALGSHTLILPNACGFDLPPAGLAEVSRHGVSADCYQDIFNLIVARGYRPVFVDGYDVDGKTYFNATFRSGGPAWGSRHGLDGNEYQDYYNDMTAAGFRLQQVDSYLESGGVRYAAIFEWRSGPLFDAFHGLTEAEYDQRIDDRTAAGYVPINVSTVEVGGQRYWTGLLERFAVASAAVESVEDGLYQATFNANVAAGRLPIYVQGYSDVGQPGLTGIWIDPIGSSWSAAHGLDKDEYQTAFNDNLAAGRLTRYTSGYDDGTGTARFAAVWRARPDTRISDAPPAAFNETSATFEFAANVPFGSLRCRLDANFTVPCTSPMTVNGLSEGYHTFSVYSLDRESVRDLTPATHDWLVDVTPPTVEIVSPAEGEIIVDGELIDRGARTTTVYGWTNIVVAAGDNLSGIASVDFRINGVPAAASHNPTSGNWTAEFRPTMNEMYRIEAVATDGAGNSALAHIWVLGVPERPQAISVGP